ncbi:glutamine amidotransferas-like protein class-I [Thamnocephalis sphaerospora]|uniref:Glutamine amidotransferas-like protein class-I n=1 Tax=Thamnocephalis sphaerospora TaxID=78915 RepID=A0A4P9XQQ7_9FUNG|nr:glutamine amidotransferas-like protein class-I [Thamnocephalis sphaerospora]|eukprot:RKP08387.1 glutamine amidotransferas-like protein class-I [Thamnocephalis sphaerospora]
MRVLRVALLIADTPPPEVVAKYGDYNVLYTQLLQRALRLEELDQSVQLETVPFDVVEAMAYPEQPETFDAILISGSAATAHEGVPWILRLVEYTRELPKRAPTCRLVGICFGHQIIARALGGQLQRNERGWELGWTKVTLNALGQQVLQTEKPALHLQQVHRDHVTMLPPGFEVLASTVISPLQMMWKPGHIFAVQAHPEFVPGVVREIIAVRRKRGVFSDELADASLAKLDRENDSDWLGGWIARFMLQQTG